MSSKVRAARAAAVVLGVLVVAPLPEVAVAQPVSSGMLGTVTDEISGQYGTSRRVARRTSRRTSRRHAGYGAGSYAYAPGAYGAAVVAVPAGVAYVTSLPAGCVTTQMEGATFYECGAVRYRPYYQGETLVYVEE